MRLVEQLKAVRMSDGKLAEYREKWDECSETCEAAGCTMPSIKQQVIIFAAGLDFRRYGNTVMEWKIGPSFGRDGYPDTIEDAFHNAKSIVALTARSDSSLQQVLSFTTAELLAEPIVADSEETTVLALTGNNLGGNLTLKPRTPRVMEDRHKNKHKTTMCFRCGNVGHIGPFCNLPKPTTGDTVPLKAKSLAHAEKIKQKDSTESTEPPSSSSISSLATIKRNCRRRDHRAIEPSGRYTYDYEPYVRVRHLTHSRLGGTTLMLRCSHCPELTL